VTSNKNRRIIVLSEIFPPRAGGSGRWLWELYRRLPTATVKFVVGCDSRQAEFDRQTRADIDRSLPAFTHWGLMNYRGTLSYARSLAALRRACSNDYSPFIHAARCLPEGLVAYWAKRLWGTPYLCFVHGEELAIYGRSRELKWLVRRVMKHADYFVVNSRNTAALLHNAWNVSLDRIRLLYPGVDTNRFIPHARDLTIRHAFGWGDRTVLLTVSRLQRRKGHDMLLQVLPSLIELYPNLLYVIAGDGEERRRLETLAKQLGLLDHVQFMGEVPEASLVQAYQQCDAFVLPNRTVDGDFEGFGLVLLEAQSCGKPVLAGSSGGTAETMSVGESGIVVDCEQTHSLIDGVNQLLESAERRAQMGCAGRSWTVDRFDWENLAAQAAEMFGIGPVAQHGGADPIAAASRIT